MAEPTRKYSKPSCQFWRSIPDIHSLSPAIIFGRGALASLFVLLFTRNCKDSVPAVPAISTNPNVAYICIGMELMLYNNNASKKIKLSKTEKTVVNFGLNFTDQLTLYVREVLVLARTRHQRLEQALIWRSDKCVFVQVVLNCLKCNWNKCV